MSILKSFLGALAANAVSESKQAEKDRQSQLNNEMKVLDLSGKFIDYLIEINCRNADYVAIDEQVAPGDIYHATQIIKAYKDQLKEYMRLGGNPIYICELDKMDLYIEIVRRLKEYGWLDKQDQYVEFADDTYFLDFDWERAQKENHKNNVQIAAIITAANNELHQTIKSGDCNFIPYEGHSNAVTIEIAKSNDETIDNLLDFLTVSLVFSDEYILIYNDEHDEMYYKETVSCKNVDIDWYPISDGNWSLVEINGLSLLFNTEKAKEVSRMYGNHNVRLAETLRDQYNAAYEDINSLSGVEFERVCKDLLENMGFSVETTKTTGDGGIDLIAHNFQPLLSGKYIIQCKRYTGSVGEPVIRDLYGVVTAERANKGILMTTGHFTKSAISFSNGKPIELIDGVKLKELLSNYGLSSEYGVCTETKYDEEPLIEEIPIETVFNENFMIEDEYDNYINTLKSLEETNDEMERAEFINQMLYWTLSEFADVSEYSHKLAFFKEIKRQIVSYVYGNRVEKSKHLAFIYQMIYVQISILEGNFKDAEKMFSELMKNKELQFNAVEAIEPSVTKPLFDEHIAVFSCMYYTFYDMVQMANILGNEQLSIDLLYGTEYYGYKILSKDRMEDTIEFYQKQGEGRERYWLGELEAYNNIENIYCLYYMSNYEPQMYFDYTYHGGRISDISLDRHSISVQGNKLNIDDIGTIDNLQSKIRAFMK